MADRPKSDSRDAAQPTGVITAERLLAGKYKLGRLLGEGGMGAVYEAEHTGLGVKVAVKLLGSVFAANEDAVNRFRREARIAASIRHENIVAVTDIDTDDDGNPFIVMELLEGESLQTLMRRERQLTARSAVAIATQLLSGLAAAHDQRVIHRDLKPGNIFLARERDGTCRVKVLDFGVSKFFGDSKELTSSGAVVGTLLFMAPEQARGRTDLDVRVDVYAAGTLLYVMLTGRLPFAVGPTEQIAPQIIKGRFPPPRSLRPEIPVALESVVLRAMATERDDRYSDARTFLEDLKLAMPSTPSDLRPFGSLEPVAEPEPASVASTTPRPPPPQSEVTVPYPLAPIDLPTSERATSTAVALSPHSQPTTLQARSARSRPLAAVIAVALIGLGAWSVHQWGSSPARAPAGATGAGRAQLRFGMSQYLPAGEVRAAYQPLVEYLGGELGRPVELVISEDYFDLGGKLANGELDFVALSPYNYVRAKRKLPGLKLLAMPATAGGSSYEGVILARAGAQIADLRDLRGKIFCYVSPNSTSGYLYPRALLRRAGMDPDKAFAATRFAGDHLAALRALNEGACDGAAVYSSVVFESKVHNIPPSTFRILASTDRIPYDAYCASEKLGPEATAALQRALLTLKPGTPVATRVFTRHNEILGFATVQDSDFESVRAIERYLDEGARK